MITTADEPGAADDHRVLPSPLSYEAVIEMLRAAGVSSESIVSRARGLHRVAFEDFRWLITDAHPSIDLNQIYCLAERADDCGSGLLNLDVVLRDLDL
jgi:hypothetical protein